MVRVSVVMGSKSDWPTMSATTTQLEALGIAYERKIISAHRMPNELTTFAQTAKERGIQVIIAGAGGAAHLPGMLAAQTTLPVIGVPIKSRALNGVDSLLSIVQMPAGVPVGTVAIGEAGATNAAHLAAQIIGLSDPVVAEKVAAFRTAQHQATVESEATLDD